MARYQTIKDWPEDDRPRERLLNKGAQALTDTELLAIILRIGNASTGESAIDHARLLLTQFDGFRGIDEASVSELEKVKGASGLQKLRRSKPRWKSRAASAITNGKPVNRCGPRKMSFSISGTTWRKKNANSSTSSC